MSPFFKLVFIVISSCYVYGLLGPYLIGTGNTFLVVLGFILVMFWTVWLIKEIYYSVKDFYNDMSK